MRVPCCLLKTNDEYGKTALTLHVVLCLLLAFNVTLVATPPQKGSSGVVYIDISITQENVEDCFDDTSVSDLPASGWLTVFPNPNQGRFTIEIEGLRPYETVKIEVLTLAGEVVFDASFVAENYTSRRDIDLAGLRAGLFFMRVYRTNGIEVSRLVIF